MNALATLLAAGLAAAAPADAAASAPPATVLVAPFTVKLGPAWTGLALADALLDAVVQQDQDSFLTLKQLDAVLRRRDLSLTDLAVPKHAAELAAALGATELITGSISVKGEAVSLEGERLRLAGNVVVRSAAAQGKLAELPQLAFALAKGLGAGHGLGPITQSTKALEHGSRCLAGLSRQSLAPRSRAVLGKVQLDEAEGECLRALEADPHHPTAQAGLAVAQAVRGKYAEARKAAAAASGKRFSWWGALAEYYSLRRAGEAAASRAALAKAVEARPGFLHALGYLGEEQIEASDDPGALQTFERYLARAPGQPWAIGKKGRALARMGRGGEAIAITKAALEERPDPELQIELASRYIDTLDDASALKVLLAVLAQPPVRPLALLRLGYVYLRGGKLEEARAQFTRAVTESRRVDEARTRALAYADLAQVAGRQGSLEDAVRALAAARGEGLRRLPCELPELSQWKGTPAFDKACSAEGAPAPGAAVDDEDELVAVELQ
jgi:tetratricopeptide (TPR) repeat protein